jgi:hypothetical protein
MEKLTPTVSFTIRSQEPVGRFLQLPLLLSREFLGSVEVVA